MRIRKSSDEKYLDILIQRDNQSPIVNLSLTVFNSNDNLETRLDLNQYAW